MDDLAQAKAYAAADFAEANQLFITLLTDLCGNHSPGRLLDLGCGPGDIALQLGQQFPGCEIDALDGAQAMLDLAIAKQATHTGVAKPVNFICSYLPSAKLTSDYDVVASNSLLHHMADPADLWTTIRQCGIAGAKVLVMDLARPENLQKTDQLIAEYAADAPEVLRTDFYNSLLAAYTPAEVEAQLQQAGLGNLTVSMVSNRHLAVSGRL